MSSQLIINNSIVDDEWQLVMPPKADEEVKKQAGKVVIFKLTGEGSLTNEQIENTIFSKNGKVILPVAVFLHHQKDLKNRISKQEIGIWMETHEEIDSFINEINDINLLPLISVRVKKFADGRIFSIGNLLRLKYKYKNELRAIGDVLRDQLFFLKRSGFNSFHIREDRDAKDALLGLNDFTTPYQGAVDQKQPAWKIIKR
jgi:uncharacterized protein (DUF934 family)